LFFLLVYLIYINDTVRAHDSAAAASDAVLFRNYTYRVISLFVYFYFIDLEDSFRANGNAEFACLTSF